MVFLPLLIFWSAICEGFVPFTFRYLPLLNSKESVQKFLDIGLLSYPGKRVQVNIQMFTSQGFPSSNSTLE